MLGWLDPVCSWPEIVPTHAICGCRVILMSLFLVVVCNAVVLYANWVMAVGPAVVAHVAGELEFTSAAETTTAAAAATAATVAAIILLVCKQLGEKCDGVHQELDLGSDAVDLGVLGLRCVTDVCCQFGSLFFVSDHGTGNLLDVFPDLVAHIGQVVCIAVTQLTGGAAAVLHVSFEILH